MACSQIPSDADGSKKLKSFSLPLCLLDERFWASVHIIGLRIQQVCLIVWPFPIVVPGEGRRPLAPRLIPVSWLVFGRHGNMVRTPSSWGAATYPQPRFRTQTCNWGNLINSGVLEVSRGENVAALIQSGERHQSQRIDAEFDRHGALLAATLLTGESCLPPQWGESSIAVTLGSFQNIWDSKTNKNMCLPVLLLGLGGLPSLPFSYHCPAQMSPSLQVSALPSDAQTSHMYTLGHSFSSF